MRLLHFLVLLILVALPVQAAEDFQARLFAQSRYYGVGWQSNGSHWSIELVLSGQGGQIGYPSVECAGTWTLIEAGPNRLQFIEQITSGIENCIPLGAATLEPLPDGALLYTWKEHSDKIDARAVLVPLAQPRLPYMSLLIKTLTTVPLDYMLPEFSE